MSEIEPTKLVVHWCRTGETHKCIVESVTALQRFVRDHFKLEPKYQIMLCGHKPYARLHPKKPLVVYFADNGEGGANEVFVFDRKALASPSSSSSSSRSPSPSPNSFLGDVASGDTFQLHPQNVYVPSDPSELALNKRAIPARSSPLVAALVDFECQFIFHQRQGAALLDGAKQRVASIKACVGQIRVLRRSIQVAMGNYKSLYDSTMERCRDFEDQCGEQQKLVGDILGSFDEDVARLGTLSLHHSLRASARHHQTLSRGEIADDVGAASSSSSSCSSSLTLRDLVNMDLLRKSLLEFEKYSAKVETKLSDVRAMISRVEEEGGEMVAGADTSGKSPNDALREIEESAAEKLKAQAQDVDKLDDDVDGVTSRVTEVMSGIMSASTSSVGTDDGGTSRPRRASSASATLMAAIEELDDVHAGQKDDIIPAMLSRDEALRALMSRCADEMASARRDVGDRLLSLSSTQTRIRAMSKKISVLRTMMGYQQTMMQSLSFVRHLPSSYVASVAEVVRRHAFAKLYSAKVEQLAEQVARLREGELRKRERFLQEHARHMPENLVNSMGLGEWQLPLCEIMLKPFDIGLPKMSPKDVSAARRMLEAAANADVDAVFQAMEMEPEVTSSSSSAGRGALLLGAGAGGGSNILELENAALRAEVAALRGDAPSAELAGESCAESAGVASKIVEALTGEVDSYKRRIRELEAQLNAQSR